jgi:hypothetical protein
VEQDTEKMKANQSARASQRRRRGRSRPTLKQTIKLPARADGLDNPVDEFALLDTETDFRLLCRQRYKERLPDLLQARSRVFQPDGRELDRFLRQRRAALRFNELLAKNQRRETFGQGRSRLERRGLDGLEAY